MPLSDPPRVPFADFQPEFVRTLRLPPPDRPRPDERIVAIVLRAFSSGAFAQRVEWRPPPQPAVAAIRPQRRGSPLGRRARPDGSVRDRAGERRRSPAPRRAPP